MLRKGKYLDPSDAAKYSNNNDVQFLQAKDFVDAHNFLIKGPILDIGCGDGRVSAYIANSIASPVAGVDISVDRINYANTLRGRENLKFFIGDAARLNVHPVISDKRYQTVVSFNALHHLPRNMQPKVFSDTKNLLNEDGVAVFMIPGRSPDLHDAIDETANSEKWSPYFITFTLANVRTYETAAYYGRQFIHAGFYRCKTATEEMNARKLNKGEMMDFMRGWLPHLVHLKLQKAEEKIVDAFLEDITTLYFKKRGKDVSKTVNPKIMQQQIIGYVSDFSFFKNGSEVVSKERKISVERCLI